MSGFVRRVVTGHDKSGKAIVISDGIAPMVHHNAFVAAYKNRRILYLLVDGRFGPEMTTLFKPERKG